MILSIRDCAIDKVELKEVPDASLTGPPRCDALNSTLVSDSRAFLTKKKKKATHRRFISTLSSSLQAVVKCSKLMTTCAICDKLSIVCNFFAICLLTWSDSKPSNDCFGFRKIVFHGVLKRKKKNQPFAKLRQCRDAVELPHR